MKVVAKNFIHTRAESILIGGVAENVSTTQKGYIKSVLNVENLFTTLVANHAFSVQGNVGLKLTERPIMVNPLSRVRNILLDGVMFIFIALIIHRFKGNLTRGLLNTVLLWKNSLEDIYIHGSWYITRVGISKTTVWRILNYGLPDIRMVVKFLKHIFQRSLPYNNEFPNLKLSWQT